MLVRVAGEVVCSLTLECPHLTAARGWLEWEEGPVPT